MRLLAATLWEALDQHGMPVHIDVVARIVNARGGLDAEIDATEILKAIKMFEGCFEEVDKGVFAVPMSMRVGPKEDPVQRKFREAEKSELVQFIREAVAAQRYLNDVTVAHLERLLSPNHRGSATKRIRGYLLARRGEWVSGEEISIVAGIEAWARRIRELRQDGLEVDEDLGNYRAR